LLSKEEVIHFFKSNKIFNKRKDVRVNKRFVAWKHRLFLVAIILCVLSLIAFYFTSPYSNLYYVSVAGNDRLDAKEIRDSANLSYEDKFMSIFNNEVKERVLSNPYIASAEVKKLDHNIIDIDVVEKKLYAYIEEAGTYKIYAENGELLDIGERTYLLTQLPLIAGFDEAKLKEISFAFSALNYDILNEISEIHSYPFSYDENNMEIIMRDGNYVFAGPYALKYLESYYEIISALNNKENGVCLYFDDVTQSGYQSSCPWQSRNLNMENQDGATDSQ